MDRAKLASVSILSCDSRMGQLFQFPEWVVKLSPLNVMPIDEVGIALFR